MASQVLDDEEELEARFEGEWYRWQCPVCEDVHEVDWDPRGEQVECPCGWSGRCANGT